MRIDRGIWACPKCSHVLEEDLSCSRCAFTGHTGNGLIYLYAAGEEWDKCINEKNGWVNIAKELGLYRENDDHFYLPDGRTHLSDFFGESKRHIDKLLAIEDFNDKLCLDLGAWIGWVECYILKKYASARLIALDVNDDHIVGLGRSNALKKHLECAFHSLVADMHYIPIADNSLDIVFSVDALHHFRDLRRVFSEIERVLKPNGRFYGLNEPDRPEGLSETQFVQAHVRSLEIKHGVVERRPTIREYLKYGSDIKLQVFNDAVGLKKNIDTPGLFLRGEKRRL